MNVHHDLIPCGCLADDCRMYRQIWDTGHPLCMRTKEAILPKLEGGCRIHQRGPHSFLVTTCSYEFYIYIANVGIHLAFGLLLYDLVRFGSQ